MLNILLFIFILMIIFSLCNYEKMTDNYNAYLNSKSSIIIRNDVYKPDEKIEITNLPSCEKHIVVEYGQNINSVNNDKISIHEVINEPLIHTIEVDNNNYNLVKVEFRKTNFTYNDKDVGLSLHLVHSSFNNTINKFIIVIPLDLVDYDSTNIEGFKNTFYNKMENYFYEYNGEKQINEIKNKVIDIVKNKFNLGIKYKRNYNIKNINIDLVISKFKEIDLPNYQCCKNNIGPITLINLCPLKTIIENNNKFYIIKEENGNISLITEPCTLTENIGLQILERVYSDDNLIYLK